MSEPAPEKAISVRRDFRRYMVGGLVAAGTDFFVYFLLVHYADMAPVWAHTISKIAGAAAGFTLHKTYSFKNRGTARRRVQFARYWTVWMANYALTTGLIWLFTARFAWDPMLAKLLVQAAGGCFAFAAQRMWTFR